MDHPQGLDRPQAAGVIHTDFERGFIKAEIDNCGDLFALGTESAVAAKSKSRNEGKEQLMRDWDVVHFRFNVRLSALRIAGRGEVLMALGEDLLESHSQSRVIG